MLKLNLILTSVIFINTVFLNCVNASQSDYLEEAVLRESMLSRLEGSPIKLSHESIYSLLNAQCQEDTKYAMFIEPLHFTFKSEREKKTLFTSKKIVTEYLVEIYAISQCLWHCSYQTKKKSNHHAYMFEGPFKPNLHQLKKLLKERSDQIALRKDNKPLNSYLRSHDEISINLRDRWLMYKFGYERSVHDKPDIASWMENAFLIFEITVSKVKSEVATA